MSGQGAEPGNDALGCIMNDKQEHSSVAFDLNIQYHFLVIFVLVAPWGQFLLKQHCKEMHRNVVIFFNC